MNILSSINEFEVEVIRERIKDVKRNKNDSKKLFNFFYLFERLNILIDQHKSLELLSKI